MLLSEAILSSSLKSRPTLLYSSDATLTPTLKPPKNHTNQRNGICALCLTDSIPRDGREDFGDVSV